MKTTFKTILLLTSCLIFTSCGSSETTDNSAIQQSEESIVASSETTITDSSESTIVDMSEDTNNITESESNGSFIINKQIYTDDRIDLFCKEINENGILFECNNKTPRDLDLSFNISLDGIRQRMWSDVNDSTILSGETKEFMYHYNNSATQTEHKFLTIAGIGFVEGSEYMSFDIVDFDLGGTSNPDSLSDGTPVFESEIIDLEFVGLNAKGLEFIIDNKTNISLEFFLTDLVLNGDINGYGSATTMPARSKGIFQHSVTSYVKNFNGDDIKSFTGIILANIPNQGSVTLCELNYDNGIITSTPVASDINIPNNNNTESSVNIEEETISKAESSIETNYSITQEAFDAATNMTKADLTGHKGNWEYHGLLLTPDDCEWVDSSLNKDGSVEPGAIYRKVGHLLEGFELKVNNGKAYCDMVFGVEFESRDALVPYVSNMKSLYAEEFPIVSIMRKFNSLNSVSGDYDFSYGKFGKYSIVINNTSECAEELMVSEEMLGYILARLTEYDADIQFEGTSCSIVYEGFGA